MYRKGVPEQMSGATAIVQPVALEVGYEGGDNIQQQLCKSLDL